MSEDSPLDRDAILVTLLQTTSRVETQTESIFKEVKRINGKAQKNENRIDALERSKAWLIGASAAIGVVVGVGTTIASFLLV